MLAALVLTLIAVQGATPAHGGGAPTVRWAQDAIERALAASEEISDPFRRAQALAEISEAQSAGGDDAGARASLARALAIAQGIEEEPLRSWALHDIGRADVRADDLASAESVAEAIDDPKLHDAVLAAVVDARRGARDVAGARDAARRIRDVARQGQSLRSIVIMQATESDFSGALLTARSIQHSGANALALGDVAAALARDGNFVEARSLVARIRNAQSRSRALVAVAVGQAVAGDIKGALATTAQVEDKPERAQALARIASMRMSGAPAAAREMFAQALALVAAARAGADRKSDALVEIARAQISAGEITAATATLERAFAELRKIRADAERLQLLGRIAPLQARAGDFAGAFATAMRADDASLRPLLARDIAGWQAEKGDAAGAVAVARSLDDRMAAVAALFGVMRAQWQARDFAGLEQTIGVALQAVRIIGNTELRAGALGSLAAARAQEGDVEAAEAVFTEAMDTAAAASRGQQRAAVYARIADALADRHRAFTD